MKASNNNSKRDSHEVVDLDVLDKKILEHLQKDGKLSLRQLKELTGSSVNAIKNHLDKLNEKGVIKDYIAVIDCCKVGYNEMLIFTLRINANTPINKIFKDLEKIEAINAIYQTSGNYPILCMAKCVTKQDQMELLESVKKIDGIDEVITQIVMQRKKEEMKIKIP
ncbi:MAG: Lrp/AsnC family transcriptional regulator [archaeon]|nr:Lrp/AsnC family transcriptional regulator [archaeon]